MSSTITIQRPIADSALGAQDDPNIQVGKTTPLTNRAHESWWVSLRMMTFVAWAALPLLAIVGHVFELVPMRTSAAIVIPLTVMLGALMIVAPHRNDAIVRAGFIAGMVACVPYDVFRLSAVHLAHLMGDFIPGLGVWILGHSGSDAAGLGYAWRYFGDAAGAGVGFYIVAFTVGLHRWSRSGRIVLAAVVYAVFPVWSGLVAVVALAPHGQEQMFRLTPATLLVTLIGHIIFGLVLGVAFARARHLGALLPWPVLSPRALGAAAAWAVLRSENVLDLAPQHGVENLLRPAAQAA
jgi:hypothetical protein